MSPLELINDKLAIDAVEVHTGCELKCWVHDGDGGRSKAYLTENDCREVGHAFLEMSKKLRKAALKEGTDR